MIRTEHLYKRYAGSEDTLHDVNLRVRQGEYTAVIGPSGSGKSTLMNILGCLDTPTGGAYYLRGRDVSSLSEQELSRVRGEEIGFVFQGFQLLPRLTAAENVALPLLLCGVPQAQRLRRAEALLTQVGLSHRLQHRPSQLSGGQQQRVAIARALVRDPAFILADEPTGNLDPASTSDVLTLLDELNQQGRTIVLITHDEKVARRAGRQVCISGGRLTEICSN